MIKLQTQARSAASITQGICVDPEKRLIKYLASSQKNSLVLQVTEVTLPSFSTLSSTPTLRPAVPNPLQEGQHFESSELCQPALKLPTKQQHNRNQSKRDLTCGQTNDCWALVGSPFSASFQKTHRKVTCLF